MTEQLLAVLQSHANARGVVLVSEESLRDDVPASRGEVEATLAKLATAGFIEILAPLPFLVLRLRSWSGRKVNPRESEPPAYSAIPKQQLNSSYRRPGAHWPVDRALLTEILETLGEGDGKSFEKAVELYSPHVIRIALDRVRRAKGIRKNRTALFRHLLPRLARDEHRFDQHN